MDFPALILNETADGGVSAALRRLTLADLPEGEVLVRVSHSSLNYKDGMVLNGLGRLVRRYPHVPGIDLAGVVEASDSPAFQPGDAVLLNGWRVGETHWGGYGGYARLRAGWLTPMPAGLTPRRAMALGTPGLTAQMALLALEEHGLSPSTEGEVLVTGAAGGVGGLAVALLAASGYRVAAVTGRADQAARLRALGAASILDRAEIADPAKPLLPERWAGCIDAVGGSTLAGVLASLRAGGAVAACGNAGGVALSGTILPFLLRGVALLGIDSAQCPVARRAECWRSLVSVMPMEAVDGLVTEVGLGELPVLGRAILKGEVAGRVVVDVWR